MRVVYADVLIIINTYVNFALLRLGAVITHSDSGRLRTLLGAFIGGLYSLIILVEGLNAFLSFFLKAAVSAIIVLVAFGWHNMRSFLRSYAGFFLVSFVFAGIMLALWLFVSPDTMLYNNGVVYFKIDTLTLLIATAVCYAVLRLAVFFGERRTPGGSIYFVTVTVLGESASCRGLKDSGSSFKDSFSGYPVILVSSEISDKLNISAQNAQELPQRLKVRYIPCSTATGEAVIFTFCPDKVRIKGTDCDFETDRVRIGISRNKIRNGEFEAVLPHTLFENREREKTNV